MSQKERTLIGAGTWNGLGYFSAGQEAEADQDAGPGGHVVTTAEMGQ